MADPRVVHIRAALRSHGVSYTTYGMECTCGAKDLDLDEDGYLGHHAAVAVAADDEWLAAHREEALERLGMEPTGWYDKQPTLFRVRQTGGEQ